MAENKLENQDYEQDLLTLTDEDGQEHEFEVVDAVDLDDERYLALVPVFSDPQESLEDSADLVILKVVPDEESGEDIRCKGGICIADTGNVAGFEASVQMDIRQVPGLKNKLLGGEGLFNTLLTGPGKVWLQTMPIAGVAAALMPYFPSGN